LRGEFAAGACVRRASVGVVLQELLSRPAIVGVELGGPSVKITGINSNLLRIDAPDAYRRSDQPGPAQEWLYLLTSVETDEGVTGHSMMWGPNREGRGIGHHVRDIFVPLLVGKDPLAVEARWQELRDKTRGLYPLSDSLVALLDVAFWDIAGQVAGMPIARMLGEYRDRIPAYASPSAFESLTVDGTVAEAKAVKAAGFHGYKLWCVLGPARDIPRLRAARAAVGPDYPLMADAGGLYRYTEALEVGHVLDELGYTWYEEPISDYHLPLLRRLADELRTPILAGEKTTPVGYAIEYLRQDAVDILRGDVLMKAGITGLRKMAIGAELYGQDLEIHGTLTSLLDIANLHVSRAIRNSRFVEVFWEPHYRFGLKGDPLAPDANGYVHVPRAPGLGVEIDWDWIDAHTIEEL
jgi:L-alanine-DL-glutamate epimerase-like enolase superfamily enzyme